MPLVHKFNTFFQNFTCVKTSSFSYSNVQSLSNFWEYLTPPFVFGTGPKFMPTSPEKYFPKFDISNNNNKKHTWASVRNSVGSQQGGPLVG